MVQGAIKSRAPKAPAAKSNHSSKAGFTKKGARTIGPKKSNLIKQKKITKKFSAGLTAKTEKMLGEKVGHLELLGQGKKSKENGKQLLRGKLKKC